MKELNIIFDCDGTLLKSLGHGMEAWDRALECVGARVHAPEEIIKFFGRSADKIFFELLGNREQAQRAYETYFAIEKKNIHQVVAHKGIVDLLLRLVSHKANIGIVTGRHERDLELLLNHTQMTSFFSVKVCDNFLVHHKPHPEGLKLAASKMGVTVENCFYIGDSVIDILAAKAAGARAVAALWDEFSNESEMRKAGAHYLAREPMDIWQWLTEHQS